MNPHYQYFLATGLAPRQERGDDIISPPPPPPPPPPAPDMGIRPSKISLAPMPPAPPSLGGIEEEPNQQIVDTEVNIYTQPVAPIEDVLKDIPDDFPTGGGGGGYGGGEQEEGTPEPPKKTWLPLILMAVGLFVILKKSKAKT